MASGRQLLDNSSSEPPDTTTSRTGVSGSNCSSPENVSLSAGTDDFTVEQRNDSLLFTLHNKTECPLNIQPMKAWKIERKSSSGWERVANEGGVGTSEGRTLKSGERHKWSLSLFKHPTPYGQTTTYLFVNLPDGAYKFSVTGTLGTGDEITRETQFNVRRHLSSETESKA